MSNNLDVKLHPAQLEIFNSEARFKVVSAGRRFGKSRLAAWILIIKALQSENKDVFYIGPTFQQAKDMKLDQGLFFISVIVIYIVFKVFKKSEA